VQSGKVRFILLHRLGDAVIESDIDPALLQQTLSAGANLCRG
jgi:3-dehydroquinate synthetase